MTSIIFQWKTTSTLSGASVCKITFKHIPCLALNPGSPILTHDLVVDKSMTMVVGNRAWADGPADGKRRERSQQCREGDNDDTCTCLYRQGGSVWGDHGGGQGVRVGDQRHWVNQNVRNSGLAFTRMTQKHSSCERYEFVHPSVGGINLHWCHHGHWIHSSRWTYSYSEGVF